MKIGIIKERKNPPDRRVVLTPKKCAELIRKYEDLDIVVESAKTRFFSDEMYQKEGIKVVHDVSDCDILLGVKEVPVADLMPNKKYFFFSHTIKKQPYNKNLLKAILAKNIELYDHEVLTNKNNVRVVAFGRYAGIVGAYNGFRAYGLKHNLYILPKAEVLHDQAMLIDQLKQINLPAIKIVITGKGRVGKGAREMLTGMGLREVNVTEFLNKKFIEPVFVQIDVLDYYKRKDNQILPVQDFFDNPTAYESDFMKFAEVADFYIAAHFYGAGSPYIFTRNDAKSNKFNISVVADISCDIDGPVASTIRSSTIENAIYGYHRQLEKEVDFMDEHAIAVMAVDNLPCELPKDASEGFAEQFASSVFPAFFNNDKDGILFRANMTKNGRLTDRFSYLSDYVED